MSFFHPSNKAETIFFLLSHPIEDGYEILDAVKYGINYAKYKIKNNFNGKTNDDSPYHIISAGGWGQMKWLPGIPPVDEYLEGLGLCVHRFGYYSFQDIRKSAKELSKFTRKIKEQHPHIKKLGYTGFSEGTIVDAMCLLERKNERYIDFLIAFAPPYGGTKVAELAPWSEAARQMKTESPVIKKIKRELVPYLKEYNIPAINFFAGHDQLILPRHESKIPGIRNRFIDTTHTGVTLSDITKKEMASFLKEFVGIGVEDRYLEYYRKHSNRI